MAEPLRGRRSQLERKLLSGLVNQALPKGGPSSLQLVVAASLLHRRDLVVRNRTSTMYEDLSGVSLE